MPLLCSAGNELVAPVPVRRKAILRPRPHPPAARRLWAAQARSSGFLWALNWCAEPSPARPTRTRSTVRALGFQEPAPSNRAQPRRPPPRGNVRFLPPHGRRWL